MIDGAPWPQRRGDLSIGPTPPWRERLAFALSDQPQGIVVALVEVVLVECVFGIVVALDHAGANQRAPGASRARTPEIRVVGFDSRFSEIHRHRCRPERALHTELRRLHAFRIAAPQCPTREQTIREGEADGDDEGSAEFDSPVRDFMGDSVPDLKTSSKFA